MRSFSRRQLLHGAAVGGVAAGIGVVVPERISSAAGTTAQPRRRADSFHGPHQPGVLDVPNTQTTVAVFDVIAGDAAGLQALLATLTEQARLLGAGALPADLGPKAPPADNGILGVDADPDHAVTITVGVGASLFDDRFGLSAKRPARLTEMPTFPNDHLDPAECHGDLILQIGGARQDLVLHALRQIARNTRGAMQLRWRIDGFFNAPRPEGAQRNLFGFKDGTSNPGIDSDGEMNDLVWVGAGDPEPAWTMGGTYQVVRIIRMLVEFWDRVSLNEQEAMFGRRRDTGAPLDGNVESDAPNYAADPEGKIIGLDAHIRLAHPRTADTAASRILRRGFNYDRGIDVNGNLDMGLVFNCYQQDIQRQFEATQQRLIDEPLVDYISPTGGGYFFVLPGVSGPDDTYASGLFAG